MAPVTFAIHFGQSGGHHHRTRGYKKSRARTDPAGVLPLI
jgi:hypothetical protein